MVLLGFRRLLEAIQALTDALTDIARVQRELGPALDRLEALEHSRHHFEAECEGMLLKADGKLKAATSAEQRERQLKKANEKLADPFDPDGLEGADPRDGLEGADPRALVPTDAVHLALATNDKTHAVKTKWGIT